MPFVYFIHEEGDHTCFKIGKTENHPADRMEQLQTGNPRKLRIYRWIKISGDVKAVNTVEEYLHILFNQVHIRGEWFHVTTEQIDEQCELIQQNNLQSSISGKWEQYTDDDRLNVKIERKQRGKYRGRTDPVEAEEKKNKFMEQRQLTKMLNNWYQ